MLRVKCARHCCCSCIIYLIKRNSEAHTRICWFALTSEELHVGCSASRSCKLAVSALPHCPAVQLHTYIPCGPDIHRLQRSILRVRRRPRPSLRQQCAAHRTSAIMPEAARTVDIDGSQLEGGGQILRNAAALAAITGTPVQIDKIRAGRSKPGLRPQHAAGLRLVANICGAQLTGCEVDSTSIVLAPGRLRPGRFAADTKTAGSCMLMVQASLPCALLAVDAVVQQAAQLATPEDAFPVAIELSGGTDAAMAPPYGYSEHVLLPMLRQHLGLQLDMQCLRHGAFPKGGGVVSLKAVPLPAGSCLPPIQLTKRGTVSSVYVDAAAWGRIDMPVAERMAAAAVQALKKGDVSLRGITESRAWRPPGEGTGGSIVLVARTDTSCMFGASGLAEKGVKAEDIGRTAAESLLEALATGGCVDEWLQDQLVVFMAMASGRSQMLCGELTLHTRTAIAVAQQLTSATFEIKQQSGGQYLVTCDGAAITA